VVAFILGREEMLPRQGCRRVAGRDLCWAVVFLIGSAIPAARASPVDGIWLIKDKLALKISECQNAICGQVVWLHNPVLRTPEMCGRIIVWGLRPDGQLQWSGGWIFNPEDGTTYHLSAALQPDDTISARIYEGIALFGETKVLTRTSLSDLSDRCPMAE
jgi:uncharacterized protein (DUF2147 family)